MTDRLRMTGLDLMGEEESRALVRRDPSRAAFAAIGHNALHELVNEACAYLEATDPK